MVVRMIITASLLAAIVERRRFSFICSADEQRKITAMASVTQRYWQMRRVK